MRKIELGTIRDWLIVLASLLDDAAVLAVILLTMWFFNVAITLPLIIFIALVVVGFALLMHKAVIPSLHLKKVTGAEGMVGLEGRVVQALTPVGVIRVGSEYWGAKSAGEDIGVGESVEVLGISGLALKVRRKGR